MSSFAFIYYTLSVCVKKRQHILQLMKNLAKIVLYYTHSILSCTCSNSIQNASPADNIIYGIYI